MNWEKLYLEMVRLISQKSRDRGTKHGCVIVRQSDNSVLTVGYNGLPRGMSYTEKVHERPYKYLVTEHAERNAIYNACRNGVSLLHSTAYVTGFSCADCVRAMIQSGVGRIIIPAGSKIPEHWKESILAGISMASQCEVEYCLYHEKTEKFEPAGWLLQDE